MKKNHISRFKISGALFVFLILMIGGCYHSLKSVPSGIDYQSRVYSISDNDIDFLYDITYQNEDGKIVSEQEIFDRVLSLIKGAERYVLLDMFLFNSHTGKMDNVYRRLASEITDALIEKTKSNPEIIIDFITDPINSVYGGYRSPEIIRLRRSRINVIYTDLKKMRDSNLIYSPFWRGFVQWFSNSDKGGLFPHPFSSEEQGVSLRSYLTLLNFKANHRKIILADNKGELRGVVMSANPHDGSSMHSNVAFDVSGDFAREFYLSEQAVAKFSDSVLRMPDSVLTNLPVDQSKGDILHIQLLTEMRILGQFIDLIEYAGPGDMINIGVFYLSHRGILKSLLEASNRDVDIRIILDPNKDAFGREKNGIPNRQAANKLVRESDKQIQIRWYDTHGEQYHSKFAHFDLRDGKSAVILGSANFTRRNLDNYNLESDILVTGPSSSSTISEVRDYFEMIWKDGRFTLDYSLYEENSRIKGLISRFLESSGCATF